MPYVGVRSVRRLGSVLANKALSLLLKSPLDITCEKTLVWLGHTFPYRLPARGAVINQLRLFHAGRNLFATMSYGQRLVVPANTDGASLYVTGCLPFEEGTTNLLRRAIRPGDVVFDIGANLGFYTFLAATLCGDAGHVHAFEAQAALVEFLMDSARTSGFEDRVTLTRAVVGKQHKEEIPFFLSRAPDISAHASLFKHEWLNAAPSFLVPTVSIDQYVRENGVNQIGVVKMDIEGAEMLALQGMTTVLEQKPPRLLVVEISPARQRVAALSADRMNSAPDAAKPRDVVHFLTSRGYEARQISPIGLLDKSISEADVRDLPDATNLAFVRARARDTHRELFTGRAPKAQDR